MAPGLARQTVPILLRGLDQKQPKQTGVTGALDVLQNMMLQKTAQGGYEFVPRPGTTNVAKTADTGTISTGMRLGTLGAGLVLMTGTSCYRKAIDEWHQVAATAPTVGVDTSPITSGSGTVISSDVAYVNGYVVSAYAVSDQLNGYQEARYSIFDANGVPVVANGLVAQASSFGSYRRIRIAVAGNYFAVSYFSTLSSVLVSFIYNTATPTAAPTPVTIAGAATEIYDVQHVGSSGNVVYVWRDNGTNQLNQRLLTLSTATLSGATAYAGLTGITQLGYQTNTYSSNTIYLSHVDGTNGLRVTTFDGTTLALGSTTVYDAAITSVYNVGGYRAGASSTAYFTAAGANPWDRVVRVSTGGASTDVIRSLTLGSRVVSFGGNLYALARWSGPIGAASNFLLDLTNKVTVGMATKDKAIDTPLSGLADQMANLAPGAAANILLTCAQRIIAVETGAGFVQADTGAMLLKFTMQDPTVGRPIELNGVLNIPGAQPYVYDGVALVEHGFPIDPTLFQPSVGAGGALTPSSTYSYRITWEWTDAAGNLWISSPGAAQQVTLAAGQNQITLTLPTLRVTRKTNVSIGVYRTLANGDGSTYFKVNDPTQPVLNSTTVDSITFVDNMADTTAVGGQPIYTGGGVLENIAVPGCRTMVVHRGRLLAGAIEGDVDAVWFTKDVVPGFGVEFSDFLVSRITSVQPITAVASLDSYAVACTASQSWGSINEYPDDTGAGGVLIFQQQSDTTGCATVGVLGRNDLGLMTYDGVDKGIWRSSRGLSWDYVGSPVEDDMATASPTAIVSVPGLNQMRVVAGRTVFIYESVYGQWQIWSYTTTPAAFVDAVMWNGSPAYLCSDGTVVLEATVASGTLSDSGTMPRHIVTLSGLNLFEVAGFGRLYITQIIGKSIGGNGFTLNIDQTFDGQAMATKQMVYVDNRELDLEVDPGTMGKSSRFNLAISDTANGAESAFTIAAVTVLVGLKSGLSKLPPARRAT